MEVRSGPVGERFSELYRREYGLVYRFVLRRTNATSAEDITNETFAVAWQKFHDIPIEIEQARAWLYAVARIHILRHWHSDNKKAALHIRLADSFEPIANSPETEISTSLDLRTAWQQLTATDQEILTLLGWEELSLAAAAKTLGISVPTARRRVAKARAALRNALDDTESRKPKPTSPTHPQLSGSANTSQALQPPRHITDTNKTIELINA